MAKKIDQDKGYMDIDSVEAEEISAEILSGSVTDYGVDFYLSTFGREGAIEFLSQYRISIEASKERAEGLYSKIKKDKAKLELEYEDDQTALKTLGRYKYLLRNKEPLEQDISRIETNMAATESMLETLAEEI